MLLRCPRLRTLQPLRRPTQPLVPITFMYADESEPGPYPIPPLVPVEGGGEGLHHLPDGLEEAGLAGEQVVADHSFTPVMVVVAEQALALAGTLLPPFLFFADALGLAAMQRWLLVAAILWFVATPFWMEHKAS